MKVTRKMKMLEKEGKIVMMRRNKMKREEVIKTRVMLRDMTVTKKVILNRGRVTTVMGLEVVVHQSQEVEVKMKLRLETKTRKQRTKQMLLLTVLDLGVEVLQGVGGHEVVHNP